MKFHPYCFMLAGLAALFAARAESQDNPAASSSSKNQKAAHAAAKQAKPGPDTSVEQNLYRNTEFGFRYNVIVGWVNRTQQMQPEPEPAAGSDGGGATSNQVLLAVLERPPEATGETINSAVVIAQENASTYPGLKSAADYVGPLTELVTGKGFKPAGEAYEVMIDSKTLVRCDFTREINKLTMFQSTLVLLQKGTIVSFTFIGGSQDEVDALIERLSFSAGPAAKPR
jgi:hypothetical protein